MKPGLAILPIEVWTDIFVYPWITRKKLAQIVDQFKERKFAEKLQFVLHDYGKQSLRYLDISFKPKENSCKYQLRKRKILENQAFLTAASSGYPPPDVVPKWVYETFLTKPKPIFENCEFAETEMPQNMKTFKRLLIRFVDDQVLAFLDKIKPLFFNVYLDIGKKAAKNLRILLGKLLPMLGGIRGIACTSGCIRVLEQHFPGTLALAKELNLFSAEPSSIPSYLNWLSASLDFSVHGPRFLMVHAEYATIVAFVNAVRQQFLEALVPSAFAIYLEFFVGERHHRAEECHLEKAVTSEELTIRNAVFQTPVQFVFDAHYVEILRHPTGAGAKMRQWVKERAFYEKFYKNNIEEICPYDKQEQLIWIVAPKFGQITKKAGAEMNQDEDQPAIEDESADEGEEDDAGPSTSKKMKK